MARKNKTQAAPAKKPRAPGRPAYEPTARDRGLVEGMAICGTPEEDMAKVLGIDAKTLRKHFRIELDTSLIIANTKVAANQFKLATGTTAQAGKCGQFWLTHRAGWKPVSAGSAHPALGKKEEALEAAKTAGEGSEWGDDLLTPPIGARVN